MRAASRESLANARAQLTELVKKLVNTGTDGPHGTAAWQDLAAQLRSVAALLVAEPGLRRALSNPARLPQRRAELLESLLGSRVGAIALRVLDVVVRQRWSSAADLLGAIELLAVDSELETAASDGVLDDAEDELFRFQQIVGAHAELTQALSYVGSPVAARAELAKQLLDGKAAPVTIRLVTMALHGLGGRGFQAGLARLVELVAQRRESQVAYVRSAAPLTVDQEERLTRHLSAVYGQQISLHVRIDPAVIGGAIVEIGDDRYDGSIARLLEQARTALAN